MSTNLKSLKVAELRERCSSTLSSVPANLAKMKKAEMMKLLDDHAAAAEEERATKKRKINPPSAQTTPKHSPFPSTNSAPPSRPPSLPPSRPVSTPNSPYPPMTTDSVTVSPLTVQLTTFKSLLTPHLPKPQTGLAGETSRESKTFNDRTLDWNQTLLPPLPYTADDTKTVIFNEENEEIEKPEGWWGVVDVGKR